MSEKQRSFGRNMVLNSAGSLFYLVCQWLLSVLAVRLDSFEAAGILSTSMFVTNFFCTLSTFGIRVFQASDTARRYDAGRYISTRLLTGLFGFTCCVVFTLCNRQYPPYTVACILLYMFYRMSECFVDVLAGEEQRAYRFDLMGVSFLLRGIMTLGVFTTAMLLTHDLLLSFGLMGLSTMAVVVFFDGVKVKQLTHFRIRLSLKGSLPLLREVWPLMLNAALLTLLAAIPKYFLQMYWGDQVAGIYNSIATPAVIIQAGCSYIYTPLVVPLSEKWRRKDLHDYEKTVWMAIGGIAAFTACMFLGAWLLGPFGLELLFGAEILPYVRLLLPVLLTIVCMSAIYFFEVLLTIAHRLKTMLCIHVCAVAVTLALSLVLVKDLGMDGVNLSMYIGAGGDALCMGLTAFLAARKQARAGRVDGDA